MFNENYFKIISDFMPNSQFGEPRRYGDLETFHSGHDYNSKKFKQQNIYNLLAGQVENSGHAKYKGTYIILRHNLKFMNGSDDTLFSCYKHLSYIDYVVDYRLNGRNENNLINPGEIIGLMGNSGYSKTKVGRKKWRLITEVEQNDPKCRKGVHVHFEFFQFSKIGIKTPLIQTLFNKGWMKEEPEYYFYRYGKFYINPDIIISYCRYLQEVLNDNL